MRDKTEEKTGKLVAQVRKLALQGQTDTVLFEGRSDQYMHDAWEDIHWQTAGQFLFVYIESYGDDSSYSYRLYRCSEEARYDRRTVLDPALENEDCKCLFNFKEIRDTKYLLYLHEGGAWYEDYETAVSGLINEE